MEYKNSFVLYESVYVQYDRLMRKMGKRSDAIGFAVYLDQLERLYEDGAKFDVDAVLLYDENTDLSALMQTVDQLTAAGESVTAQRDVPEKLRYKKLLRLTESGVSILEENA